MLALETALAHFLITRPCDHFMCVLSWTLSEELRSLHDKLTIAQARIHIESRK